MGNTWMKSAESLEETTESDFVDPESIKFHPMKKRDWVAVGEDDDVEESPKSEKSPPICVFTHNLLAPRYLKYKSYYWVQPSIYLSPQYRIRKVLEELNGHRKSMDVFCLQELPLSFFNTVKQDFCEKRKFGCVYQQITDFDSWEESEKETKEMNPLKEGVAILYSQEKFKLIDSLTVELNTEAYEEISVLHRDNDEIIKDFLNLTCLISHNVGLCILLEEIERSSGEEEGKAPRRVAVSTIHSYFDRSSPQSQVYQIEKFKHKVWQFMKRHQCEHLISCGDFNFFPNSLPWRFLMGEELELIDEEKKRDSFAHKRVRRKKTEKKNNQEDNDNESLKKTKATVYEILGRNPQLIPSSEMKNLSEKKTKDLQFRDSLNLSAAYPKEHKPFTHYSHFREKKEVLDYVFYTTDGLVPTHILGNITKDRYDRFPTPEVLSDHLLLGTKFRFVDSEE